MAEDVEIVSDGRTEGTDTGDIVEIVVAVSSNGNNVSSTESSVDCIIDVVSTDSHSPAFTLRDQETNGAISVLDSSTVSSNINSENSKKSQCSSEASVSSQTLQVTESCRLPTSTSAADSDIINPASCASQSTSECDWEIIVDDLPSCSSDNVKCSHAGPRPEKRETGRKRSASGDDDHLVRFQGRISISPCFVANGSRRGLCVRSRSATPSPSFKCHTPNSPGTTARQRSVSGSFYPSPSPRPLSNPGTPSERQRAGSMGEIELRERMNSRENGVRIIDHLDISQLPRPRNPGGVLPLNGHPLPDHASQNEALDLIITQRPKRKCNDAVPQSSMFTEFISAPGSSNSSVSTTKNSHTNYLISNLIRTTPTKVNKVSVIPVPFGTSSANPLQGWTSSINECVERPKPSSEVDSEGVAKKIARLTDDSLLCTSTEDSLWRSRVPGHQEMQVRTPPERPKPPRRRFTPVPESMTGTTDRFISPSRGRRRNSPLASSSVQASISRVTPQGVLRVFKCSMCEYTTTEKSHLRRHRRLHHRSTPVNILKCGKCSYTTFFPRKMREHYHQIHHDSGTPGMVTELTNTSWLPPQRFLGSRGVEHMDSVGSSYPGPYFSHPDQMLYDRGDRSGYNYSGRQHGLNYPLEQFSVTPYPDVRGRQTDHMASNYLRSIVSSIINSESSLRHPPSSTITSSSYFMPPGTTEAVAHPNNCATSNTCQPGRLGHLDVKVKVEPDVDDSSDISSTANSHNAVTPDLQRHLIEPNVPYTQPHLVSHSTVVNTSADSSVTIEPSFGSHTDVPFTQSSLTHHVTDLRMSKKSCDQSDSIRDTSLPSTSNEVQNTSMSDDNISATTMQVNSTVKCDTISRGIQCVLPVIKTEIDLDGDYYDFYGGHRFRFHGVDRAVQCEMSSRASSPLAGATQPRSQLLSQHLNDPTHSMSESEPSDHHSSLSGDSRCNHCGISFDDDVIFSIHIGCHSHTDPFKCNVCGKQCGNKYVFYSHIMRGHQF